MFERPDRRAPSAVRARVDGAVMLIGRLVVVPDLQGLGIGTRLLLAAHAAAGPEVTRFRLFTGHLSAGNLRLDSRHGYLPIGREQISPGLELVHLERPRSG
jgi:GNAT superfamily N-acetyltransferase